MPANRAFLLIFLMSPILLTNAMNNNWKNEAENIGRELDRHVKEKERINELHTLGNSKFKEKPTCSHVNYNDNQNSIVSWALYPSKDKNYTKDLCVTVIKYLSGGGFDIQALLYNCEKFGFRSSVEAPEQSIKMLKAKIAKYEKEYKK